MISAGSFEHVLQRGSQVKEEPTDNDVVLAPTADLHEEVTDEQVSDAIARLKNVRRLA